MSYDEERGGAGASHADAELRRRILADLEAALAAEGVEPSSALLAELRGQLAPQ